MGLHVGAGDAAHVRAGSRSSGRATSRCGTSPTRRWRWMRWTRTHPSYEPVWKAGRRVGFVTSGRIRPPCGQEPRHGADRCRARAGRGGVAHAPQNTVDVVALGRVNWFLDVSLASMTNSSSKDVRTRIGEQWGLESCLPTLREFVPRRPVASVRPGTACRSPTAPRVSANRDRLRSTSIPRSADSRGSRRCRTCASP